MKVRYNVGISTWPTDWRLATDPYQFRMYSGWQGWPKGVACRSHDYPHWEHFRRLGIAERGWR